jgi:tetratricopeptide (TPR) repeat protein
MSYKEEELESGYAWDFERQERELPEDEYRTHVAILDEMDEDDLKSLDFSRSGDYILWAVAQAFEELDRRDEAVEVLKRIAGSVARHPALSYPDILLRLQEYLRDSGDYVGSVTILDQVERLDAARSDDCRERRAEILVLSGRTAEGLRLYERAMRDAPDDPWVPLMAAWSLLQRGDYDRALLWIDRGEEALRRVADEEEARRAASEIARLRLEANARSERRRRFAGSRTGPGRAGDRVSPGSAAPLEQVRQEILASLDDEEIRMVASPPQGETERTRARESLSLLHARASRGWDDAVESKNDELIAEFDDLQWEIVGLAERFGIDLPGARED